MDMFWAAFYVVTGGLCGVLSVLLALTLCWLATASVFNEIERRANRSLYDSEGNLKTP